LLAYVAAHEDAAIGAGAAVVVGGAEDGGGHGGGGALAVAAGDGDDGGQAVLEEDIGFGGEGQVLALGEGEEFRVWFDGGVDDDQVGGGRGEVVLVVPAEVEGDVEVVECGEALGEFGWWAQVGDGDLGVVAAEETCDADAAAKEAQSHDENAFAGKRGRLHVWRGLQS